MCVFQNISGLSPRAAASSGESPLVGEANGGFVPVRYAGNPSASEPSVGYGGPVRLPKYVVLFLYG